MNSKHLLENSKGSVYFSDLKGESQRNLFNKLEELLEKVEIKSRIRPNKLVAIKLHFGERGNTAFIRPIFIRIIVDKVKEYKGLPFLTDTNTLYRGSRSDAVSHLPTFMSMNIMFGEYIFSLKIDKLIHY